MTSYTRGLRLVVALALMFGVVPIDVVAAQPATATAGAASIRSVVAAPTTADRVEALRQGRGYPAALDQSQNSAPQDSALRNSGPQAPDAVSITATKRDALVVDVDSDTKADPGDTLEYTVVVNNAGSTDATGVQFADTLGANTTLVGGSLAASPAAVNDIFPVTVVGNVSINSAALSTPFSVTANDYLGLNPVATISAYDATTAQGGQIVMTTSGANMGYFTYNPLPGFEGVDTFTYTLADNTNASSAAANRTATVSITVSGMVWFINNNAAACTALAGGCGRLSNPFSSLAAFNALNNGAGNNPAANDNIFIYESGTGYSGAVALLNGQKLIGQDATASLSTITGLTPPTGSGTFPAMNSANGTFTNLINTVTLNTSTTVRGLQINSTTSTGLNDPAGAITGVSVSDVSIATTTGTAVSLSSTSGTFNFNSISSNGAANGILLITTAGSFTVNGSGSAGSGGTIRNSVGSDAAGIIPTSSENAGSGIFLYSAQNVSLNWMQLNDHANFAVYGNTVNGFTLANSVINGSNGTNAVVDEASVAFDGLTGSASVSNTSINGGIEDNFRVRNTTGSLNRITFNTANIGANSTANGNAGVLLDASGSATLNVTVQSSTFTSSRGDLFHLNLSGSAISDLILHNNTLSNNHPAIATGGGGVTIGAGNNTGSVNLTFNIDSNTFRDAVGHAILIFKSTDPGTVQGTFSNNTIGVQGTVNSGSTAGSGIKIQNAGLGTVTVKVANNHIYQYNNYGIELLTGGSASAMSGNLNATVIGNTVSNPGNGGIALYGIFVNGGTVVGDTYAICTDIGGAGTLANSIAGSGISGDIRLRQRQSTTIVLPGYSGANTDIVAVASFVAGRNSGNGAPASTASVNAPPGGGFINGSCAQPVTMLAPNRELAKSDQGRSADLVTSALGGNSKPLFSPRFDPALQPSGAPQTDRAAVINRVNDAIAPVTIGTLPAGKSVTIKFRATIDNPVPDGVTQVSNQGTVSGGNFSSVLTDDPDTVASNDPTVTPLDINADIQLLSKSDGGISVTPGQQFGYTLVYTNAGPQGAAGVVLTETVPSNATYTGSGWTCTPDSNAGSTCTNNVGIVSKNTGGSAIFTVTVVNPVPAGVTQLSNSASIGTSVTDPVPGNNNASDTTPVIATPDLTLTKSDGGTSVVPGGTVAYTLNYANAGNQGATGVVLTETIPANTTFNVGASTAGWVCTPNNNAGSSCTFSIGSLAGGGASGSVTFAVTVVNPVPAGVTQISNTASVAEDGGNGADANLVNNTASDTTPVNATPDLSITKTDGGITVVPGQVILYQFLVANNGNQGATGVVITETVPANTLFDLADSNGAWICPDGSLAGTVCTLGIGGLAGGGGSNSFVIFALRVVNPIPAGVTQISNTASVGDDGSNGADPTPGNNTASDTTPVTAAPDLQLSKSDGGVRGIPDSTIAYTLFYTNTGNQGATGVVLTDTVPTNTTFNAGASSVGWSCADGAAAGTVCTLSNGGINGGSATSSVIFAVKVDSPFPLSESAITNTARISDDGTNGVDVTPANNIATDSTPIDTVPDLAIAKSHTGNFTKGQVGATYTLHVSNAGGLPTSGTVTVTDALPVGLTATGLSGTGWTCDVGTLTCTRADVLNASASYPDITLTVDVAVNAPSTVTNTVTVSGGGESNTANDTATDVTAINKAASTTTLTSGPNPSAFGQSVMFTATVTSGVGTPTGVVTFTEGAATLGTGTLLGGVATFSTSALSVGSHNVTATYGGNANFNTSNDTTAQMVNKADSTTTLTSTPNPSVFGQSVTFTAAVSASAPGAGAPTGVVTFTEGAITMGTGTLSGGVATFSTSALSVGSHNVTATYGGDGNFNASTDSTTHIVNNANSATTLTSAPNPSVFGQSVTFTATVSASAPGTGLPTGVVTFTEGATTLGTGTLSGGVATFSTSALGVGSHNVTATYSGDGNFNTSNGATTQVVNKADSATTLTSAPNPANARVGVAITATVTVSAPGTLSGTVDFLDGTSIIGTGNVDAFGVTSMTISTLSVGTHTITARYNGNGNFNASISGPVAQVINCLSAITVTSYADSGANTLRQAIADLCSTGVIDFNLTYPATITLTSQLGINKSLTISGPGRTSLTINGNHVTRVFNVLSGMDVTIGSLTIANGEGLPCGPYTCGGGVYNYGVLTVTNVMFSGNHATHGGGGIYNDHGTLTVISTALSSNSSDSYGGGIYNELGTASVSNSTFVGNSAVSYGGGIFNPNSIMTVDNSTFSGNSATQFGSAIDSGSWMLVTNSTFNGNSAAGGESLSNAGSLTIKNTIVANSLGGRNCSGTITNGGNNLQYGGSVASSCGGSIPTADPQLASLGDYGGSTSTFALLPGSPAIDAGAACSAKDQRGVSRVGACDIGAFESQGFVLVKTGGDNQHATIATAFAQPLSLSITANAPIEPVNGGKITFTAPLIGPSTVPITTTATIAGAGASTNRTANGFAGGPYSVTVSASGVMPVNFTLTNDKAIPVTTLTSGPNPSVFGQNVIFTATVTSGAGLPTGVVTFTEGAATLGTGALAGGVATFSASALSVGSHNVIAAYGGDGNFNTSNGATTQVVNKADSATTITAHGPNPSVFGQSVTFTVTVSASAPGAGTPTGVVTFTDGAATLGTGTLSGGVATFSTSALSAGLHTITATYAGDGNFNTSSDTTSQTVNKADSATTLTSAPNPSVFGQSVTVTATVSASAPGAGTPTGVVTFTEGAITLGTGTLSGGVATFSTAALTVGAHAITASYAGDTSFNGSSVVTTTQVVNLAHSITTLTSAPNPSVFGQSVTFTATVSASAPGAGTPTGIVTLTVDATTYTQTLAGGVAAFSTSGLAVGNHSVTANYSGDGNFHAGSSSALNQVVDKANSAIVLISAPNPSTLGQRVTFTATMSASAPGAGLPTGSVAFVENAVTLGSGALDASGIVTLSTTSLSVGAHVITATYAGDINFNGSSTSTTQTVDRASSTTALTSILNPAVFGQSVTFTATVAAVAPGAGMPTGVVTFMEGPTVLGAASLTSGVATISTAVLAVGSHNVTATYDGDGNFTASTSSAFVQVVNKAGTVTSIASATSPVFVGQPATVTFTVTATAPGVGIPTGVITVTDGSISCTATLPVTSCTLMFATPGTKNVTVAYGGDNHFLASVSSPAAVINVVEVSVAGLAATNSSPNWLGSATAFTASITSGTNVIYQWNFGDGQTGSGLTTTHSFAAVGTYTATVTATNNAGSLSAQTVAVIKSSRIYLPLMMRNYVTAPDLVVTSLSASTGHAQVVIKNQGPAPVDNGFYVDLYVNPNPVPTTVNQIWYDGRSTQGIVWGVTAPLQPGQVITLTSGDAYYLADYSVFSGTLPAGTPIYAQVDSYNSFTTFGAVLENHEINGAPYNNLLGPVLSTASSTPPAIAVPVLRAGVTTLPIRIR